MSSDQSHKAGGDYASVSSIGWASGLRLSLLYTFFFSIITASLFALAYHHMAEIIREKEIKLVQSRAEEYRAWLQSGGINALEARMDEQSMQSGDIIFVRVIGPKHNYVKSLAPGGDPIFPSALNDLDRGVEGYGIRLGGESWVVASLVTDETGTVLQAAKNTRSSSATLARLRRIFSLTFIPSVVLAAAGGALVTYRRLAPIRRLITVIRDIIRSGNTHQQVELGKRGNELNALIGLFNQLLEKNNQLIRSMRHSLDNIAHDFRTPLSRINITAQTALQEETDLHQLRHALADCVEESERMNHLLTALMDVAEAESGTLRLQMEFCSVPDIIESAVELYEFVAEEKSVILITELPEEIQLEVDRVRIQQVLANLIDNALKFSPSGTTVRVTARLAENSCAISVSDQGEGIHPDDLPRIWSRLYRVDRSRSTRGMGIGLSLVKAIIEAHGGSVTAVSEAGRGSVFTIRLPSS